MLCPSCQYDNIPGADLCEGCGHDLTALSLPEPTSPFEHTIIADSLATLETPPPLIVAPDDSTAQVLAAMIRGGAGAALVVLNGQLQGIFTEHDLLMRIGADYAAAAPRPISDFMTPSPETLSCEHSIAYALNRMSVGGYRQLPVRYPDGRLALVTLPALLNYLIEHYPPPATADRA